MLYKIMKRFDLDADTINKMYEVKHTLGDLKLQSIQKLFKMFGLMPTIELSKSGKYSTKIEEVAPSITDKIFEKTSMIVLDSLTKPMKDSVGSETQNLPARSQLTEKLFGKLYSYAMTYNIAVVVLLHATVNPLQMIGQDLGNPYGGAPVLYNSKYAIQILKATHKIKIETGWG